MFHNISNPKWFGNWSRLEDDYLGNGGTDIADNFTFSKMEKTGGLFGSIIRLATAFPACDPETGHATGAWKVACESIDLDEVPLSVWERHLHKCEKEREVRMMKSEKGSEIITTICEYENSVAMPDNERLTYLDTCGIAHIKDGNGNVKAQEAYANRCSEYLRFGHEVDLAACGAYSPYDALKVCDTPEIFLKTGFEQRPMLYTQKHLFQALTPKSDYNPHRHGFSIEQVKRFPELLASPVVLANSPTREDVLLAILLATDAYDTPLIAGIKPDGTGNYGEREVETNMVLSVYSRQNFIRYFALLRDMDVFVFVSGRKIEALEDLSGLPLAENCSGLDIDRILQRPKCLG